MKYFISVIILLCSFESLQNPKLIKLPEYYEGEGVIFTEDDNYPFRDVDYKEGYTPSIEDIRKAEFFLFDNYYDYEVNVLKHFKYKDEQINKIINTKFKNPGKVIKKFCRYNRQYAGYISTSNDTIVFIGLLNFSKEKKAEQNFPNWKNEVLVGFGDYYQKNQKFYNINLSKEEFVYKLE
jgi:hypothetical protein